MGSIAGARTASLASAMADDSWTSSEGPRAGGGGSLGLALHFYMCRLLHMATNLAIDDRLLEEARRIGGQKTKKATVTEALHEYIQRRKQQRVLELFGKIDVDPRYDYKTQRRR